ncbi:DUF3558 domain-containing protein [Amycolatopsis saalfeldensis]|uniref:DUF3558 domain-containing protein n=1 Tax=Amycolatopsis saalfeldensis TaxID=394193 RepID=A0A1H8YIY0_9PSEU|nr:DUF3558 domain-containing protein [Amycolatopsis saalfeldensis]SEP52012.1 Protein of unknown function [Amycolatopsis saalfeldensis]
MRTSRTVQLTGAILGALCVLTACSPKTDSGDKPSAAPSPTSADVAANLKVSAPLPTGGLLSNPCAVIAPSQFDALNFAGAGTKREPANGSLAADCKWASKSNDGNIVFISPLPVNKNGISDIYSQKAQAAYFEPATIAGYPGVFTDVHDGRPSGNCSLWVGVTDQLAVSVNAQISSDDAKSNTCAIAQNVAEAMIKHLKGAA